MEVVERVEPPIFEWKDIRAIIFEGSLVKLGRTNVQHFEYHRFIKETLNEWNSISDYIMVTKLSFKQITLQNGKKAAQKEINPVPRFVLVLNDFPYNFEDHIKHYVYWKVGGDKLENDEVLLVAQRIQKEENAIDYLIFLNPPHLKSILDIDHGHILLKISQ